MTPNQPPVDALIQWLVRELSQILDISQEALATDEPFSYFGLDSAKAVGLMHRLGTFVGRKIPVALGVAVSDDWRSGCLSERQYGISISKVSSRACSAATTWNQPIAVIGMACRFPGAPDPAAFWDLLRSGRSAFREITSDRWDIDAWYDPDLRKAGKDERAHGRPVGAH